MALGSGQHLPIGRRDWPMGRWGTLRAEGTSALAVVNPHGGRRILDMLPPEMSGVSGWLDEPAGVLVLGAERCDRVTVVDLALDEIVESVALDRDSDVGLRSLTFFPLDAVFLGVLTEAEIFALDGDGRLLWFRAHHDLSLTLDGVGDGIIRLSGRGPDLDRTIPWTLDSSTGAEIG